MKKFLKMIDRFLQKYLNEIALIWIFICLIVLSVSSNVFLIGFCGSSLIVTAINYLEYKRLLRKLNKVKLEINQLLKENEEKLK